MQPQSIFATATVKIAGIKDEIINMINILKNFNIFFISRDNLRLKSGNVLYPENLYKAIVWTQEGNGKLF